MVGYHSQVVGEYNYEDDDDDDDEDCGDDDLMGK